MSGLHEQSLAERGEYTALAALAHHTNQGAALAHLVANARDPEALGWVVALISQKLPPQRPAQDQRNNQAATVQQLTDNLPEGLCIPADLRESLEEFVLTVAPLAPQNQRSGQPQQSWPRGEAQALILGQLDAGDEAALELAEAVLDEGESEANVEESALALLGRSQDLERRSVIFKHTDDLSPGERLSPLTLLKQPLHEPEEETLVELLDEALPIRNTGGGNNQALEDLRSHARTLAGKLSAEKLEELLRCQAESNGSQQLLSGYSFVSRLWPDKLKHLLSAGLPDAATVQLVAQAAAQMQLDPLLELGRWSYGKLDDETLVPVLQKVSDYTERQRTSEEHSKCVRALLEFALSTDDAEVAQTCANHLSEGDLRKFPRSHVPSGVRAGRLGRVCASALAREDEELSQDVAFWIRRFKEDRLRQALLEGIGHQEDELGMEVNLGFLGSRVLGYSQAARTLCSMDGGGTALLAAEKSSDPKEWVLWVAEVAVEELDEEALDTVGKGCSWLSLTEEQYGRLIAAYSRRPEVLLDESARALDSLGRPEAEMIPPRLLRELLEAALEHPAADLASRLEYGSSHYLGQMLDQRGRALHETALKFAEGLPPDADLVELLVSKRDTTQGLGESFKRVLEAYAQQLVAQASNTTLEADPRIQALTLASRAEPTLAREAAFGLCEAGDVEIRRAASDVLATTKSAEGDEEHLQTLLGEETDGITYSKLEAAIRNVKSGDIQEAIRHLWNLVDREPDGTCTAEVLLPGGWRRDSFIECVDIARARSGGEPSGYIGSLITLTELIVEVALVARYDATGDPNQSLRDNEVGLIRRNDPTKPDAGALIVRQQLVQGEFGWFQEVGSLRHMRSVHPEPANSTTPLTITPADVAVADGLFTAILSGWHASMLETRRLASETSPSGQ